VNRTLPFFVARSLRWLGMCWLGLCWLSSSTAHAQTMDSTTRSTARQLGQEGVQAYQAGDYDLASERLERAYALVKAPSLAFWSAQALEQRGKLVEASERYLEATRLGIEDTSQTAVQEKAKADAQVAHDSLAPRIPRLTLALHGATASELEVTLDGSLLPTALLQTKMPVNPGPHEVVAKRGRQTARASMTLTESSSTTVNLRFQESSATAEVDTAGGGKTGPKANVAGPIVLLVSGAVVMLVGIGMIASTACDPVYVYCEDQSGLAAAGAVTTVIGVGAAVGGGVWLGLKLSRAKAGTPEKASAGLSLVPVRAGVGVGLVGRF
jgi:hypothetical protein